MHQAIGAVDADAAGEVFGEVGKSGGSGGRSGIAVRGSVEGETPAVLVGVLAYAGSSKELVLDSAYRIVCGGLTWVSTDVAGYGVIDRGAQALFILVIASEAENRDAMAKRGAIKSTQSNTFTISLAAVALACNATGLCAHDANGRRLAGRSLDNPALQTTENGSMTSQEHYAVRRVSADEAVSLADQLTDVLLDCVEGGASVSFMLPLARETAVRFWLDVGQSVSRGERTLLVAQDAQGIIGTVQLITNLPENQPHRADVAKLLVHRRARNRGVGQRLMEGIEHAARDQGRTVLVLDTADQAAERLYQRLGWRRVGAVPDYALMPNGALCSTTFFYKHVRAV